MRFTLFAVAQLLALLLRYYRLLGKFMQATLGAFEMPQLECTILFTNPWCQAVYVFWKS